MKWRELIFSMKQKIRKALGEALVEGLKTFLPERINQ